MVAVEYFLEKCMQFCKLLSVVCYIFLNEDTKSKYAKRKKNTHHYIISKSDILEINCSSIALLEKCISQDTEPLQGAYDKI